MTDNDLDGGQHQGTEGNQPEGSGSAGDKQGSFDAIKLQSTLEALAKRLDEVDARSKSLQGDKDRGVNKANSEVEVLKKKIADLEKYRKAGYDDDAALEEMSFRDSVQEVRKQIEELKAVRAGNAVVDVDKVVSEFGLTKDDPTLTASLTGRQFKTDDEVRVAVAKFIQGRVSKPIPSDGDKSSVPVSPPLSGLSSQDVEAKSLKLRAMYKAPSKYKAEIAALEKELEPHLPK